MKSAGPADHARESERLAELLGRVAGGDSAAFGDFYSHTSARVYGMVLRVLRDPGYSEETTQEVYLQVWQNAGSFDAKQGSAMSWVVMLAHRRAVDRVRSEQAGTERDAVYGAATWAGAFDTVAEEVMVRAESNEVGDCLGSLTEVQKRSVVLAYYGGLTYREVAERLAVALPTVKTRIRDGLIRLRRCLGVAA
ncbi:sigma-70 family RNA polymerase sigma factor [Rhodococcus rhodnii]|uniref:RNA polymerase sigma factor SigK n=2 Tax=Rhodococcus rhodnii TaxID=38312 RepID=R7WNN4_9NOCA|nr:sigma-70 family RNA polymerase sigma factor [Rhodococcus rhodnii]EOM76913.1 RNA polymerase sigma factor SigK [Rhodococcus rhodnii LMG 5362]TXG89731.1 sigma-70 family RNA polymerase sigma factor [Rhodococcus rhodnii]